MLHAHIRTPHEAFHFIGEATPYNLQTLHQHVRQSMREDGDLELRVELDESDEAAFARSAGRWLPQVIAAGAAVRLDVLRGV